MVFKMTDKQTEALSVISGDAVNIMLFGGSRSGKTFLHIRNIILRALKAPGSRHCILRFRFNHIKSSIIFDTFPKVLQIAFAGVNGRLNKSDWFFKFDNGSEIWFGGLDDKERTEKILGNEYVTIYLNECSQIPYNGRSMVLTRLAQKVMCSIENREPVLLKPRMYYDCNPPTKGHWTYLLFSKKIDPDTKKLVSIPSDFVSFQMNPQDNLENLSDGYIQTLQSLSPKLQKRFLLGEFGDDNPNALFRDEIIDKWRVIDGIVPELIRIIVGVDPSGADDLDNADNDAIGIVVCGLAVDGNVYVLEDCTIKAGPATWGRIATSAYDRHEADLVVGEVNYGGAMVNATIQVARPRTPFKAVTSSRGKTLRAEPFSALYENGKIRHVGIFRELEDELTAFSTIGYTGDRSPNRADALIFCLAELFPAIVNKKEIIQISPPLPSKNYFNRK